MSYQIVFNTCPDLETAKVIATALVESRLAACVNIVPTVISVYQWQQVTESAQECLLMIKSEDSQYAELQERIRELHPYELPEIVAVSIAQGLPEYLHWIEACLAVK